MTAEASHCARHRVICQISGVHAPTGRVAPASYGIYFFDFGLLG
jgi:hypothetical protein